jgi:hypothetical protein
VPRDFKRDESDTRNTTLARTSSIYIRQTRPLVREGAAEKQDPSCQRVINIWPWAPDGARHHDLLIDWPSVAMRFWLTDNRFITADCDSDKWQTSPLDRESAPHQQTCNCLTVITSWS